MEPLSISGFQKELAKHLQEACTTSTPPLHRTEGPPSELEEDPSYKERSVLVQEVRAPGEGGYSSPPTSSPPPCEGSPLCELQRGQEPGISAVEKGVNKDYLSRAGVRRPDTKRSGPKTS